MILLYGGDISHLVLRFFASFYSIAVDLPGAELLQVVFGAKLESAGR